MVHQKSAMTDEMIDDMIDRWEAFKPARPSRPEPLKWLIFLPMRPVWISILLLQPFHIAMRITGWRAYRDAYRKWCIAVADQVSDITRPTSRSETIVTDDQRNRLEQYSSDMLWRMDVGM